MAPVDTVNVSEKAHHQALSKRAYVTFLAGNGDYVKGVVGLAKGLRKVKSAYPLVVAMLPDVPEEHRVILRSQGCVLREIDPVHPPDNQVEFAMAYYVLNYSKLRIWNVSILILHKNLTQDMLIVESLCLFYLLQFEDYSKMMYLDADIQVFDNIDNLFDLPDGYFHAVMDCFCEKTWSHSPQYSIGYCQQCPEKVTWPEDMESPPPPLYFNAGMFVFEPSLLTYENLLQTLETTPPSPFAEQVSYIILFYFLLKIWSYIKLIN